MGTTINGAFGHEDEEIVCIFPNGQQHTLLTCASIDYANNGSTGRIDGNQPEAVALAGKKLDPKWAAEIAKHELTVVIGKMMLGSTVPYMRQSFIINVSYRHPAHPLTTDVIEGCQIDDDGHKSQTGDPAMVSWGGPATKVKPNGVDPVSVPA